MIFVFGKQRSANFRYEWQLRMRPDVRLSSESVHAIKNITAKGAKNCVTDSNLCAWINAGGFSDLFSLMTRSAAPAYGGTFKKMWVDHNCAALPSGPDFCQQKINCGRKNGIGPGPCQTLPRANVETSIECLYFRQLYASGVNVMLNRPHIDSTIVRR